MHLARARLTRALVTISVASLIGCPRLLSAQSGTHELPLKHDPQPTTANITPADLMTRLYIFADDSMQGRRVGTEGHRRGTAYIEREVRRLGLAPAGDSGGYFQNLPVFERTLAATQTLTVGGTSFRPWIDFLPRANGPSARPLHAAPVAYSTHGRHILDSRRRLHARRRDSIYNGADDDGSGTVAVLEIAEALASAPVKPKRSILFIWHAGEEEGLWGSEYFTDHPTVPRDSIVTELNIDMIGRGRADDVKGGGPGYVQLIGSRRLSTELGDLVEAVAKTEPMPFKFDYQYDANGHPQQYYCRSDHYEYARYGIPIVFFSTGGHRDYHQVTDEPQYIDYDQLARVSSLVRDVAIRDANIHHRLVVDKRNPDPPGQ